MFLFLFVFQVSVWLYENVNTRIEGKIVGFDEYMNLVSSIQHSKFDIDKVTDCHLSLTSKHLR